MNTNDLLVPSTRWLHLVFLHRGDVLDDLRHLQIMNVPKVDVRHLRGLKSRTTAACLDEIAAALQFPPYSGGNWDAFNDSLRDLTGVQWELRDALIVVVCDAECLLIDEPLSDLGTFIRLFGKATEHWAKSLQFRGRVRPPKALHLVLQAAPEQEADLMTRLDGLRVDLSLIDD